MSMSMFSIVPMPQIWDDKAMNLMMAFFPLVGVVIGALWWGLGVMLIHIPPMLAASVIMLIPFVLSGFIHLDGYMDTSDAVFSRRDMVERRKILKDSHVGAFAVVMLGVLFLISFSAVYTIISNTNNLLIFIFIPIISRSLSGIVMLILKPFSESGYAFSFKRNTKLLHVMVIIVIASVSFVLAYLLCGAMMLLPLVAMVVATIITTIYMKRQFGGISGDLCGFILVVNELIAIVVMAICIGGIK